MTKASNGNTLARPQIMGEFYGLFTRFFFIKTWFILLRFVTYAWFVTLLFDDGMWEVIVVVVRFTAWKVSKYGVFFGPYFPAFSPNTGKYGPENLLIWTRFTQWFSLLFSTSLITNNRSTKKYLSVLWLIHQNPLGLTYSQEDP